MCRHGGRDIIAIKHVQGIYRLRRWSRREYLGGARLITWLLGRVSVGLVLAREHYPTYPLKYWHEGSPSSIMIHAPSCHIDTVCEYAAGTAVAAPHPHSSVIVGQTPSKGGWAPVQLRPPV